MGEVAEALSDVDQVIVHAMSVRIHFSACTMHAQKHAGLLPCIHTLSRKLDSRPQNNGYGMWQRLAQTNPAIASRVCGFIFDCGVMLGDELGEV